MSTITNPPMPHDVTSRTIVYVVRVPGHPNFRRYDDALAYARKHPRMRVAGRVHIDRLETDSVVVR